jgi:hypothetical protein
MACWFFKELKLGLFAGLVAEEEISQLVFKKMGTIPQKHSEHTFELCNFSNGGIEIGLSGKWDIWDTSHPDMNIGFEESANIQASTIRPPWDLPLWFVEQGQTSLPVLQKWWKA